MHALIGSILAQPNRLEDVFVLPERATKSKRLLNPSRHAARGDAIDASTVIAADDVTVIDLSRSPDYRRRHISGTSSRSARGSVAQFEIAPAGDVVLTGEDEVLASLAVTEVKGLAHQAPVHWLKGGTPSGGSPDSRSRQVKDGGPAGRRLAQAL